MADERKLSRSDFSRLLAALRARGYELIGPTLRGGAVTYDSISGAEDLPAGFTDRQSPGRYELRSRDDSALFGYASPAQSFKRHFHAPSEPLLTIRRGRDGLGVQASAPPARRLALIGARACDLAGLERLDRVMMDDARADLRYRSRREHVFVVAVNCGAPASTCFCTSMGTGPEVTRGFDLALTEIGSEGNGAFVASAGTSDGQGLLDELGTEPASDADRDRASAVLDATRAAITRHLDTAGIKERLQNNPEHPAWDEVAERCLACTNCTMVCPTCFCSTVEDTTSLGGDVAERVRSWDSCHTESFSYVHGGSVRSSIKARYRHWLTHKFAHWYDQFGSSGCVGCGRCITWCPVGIDTVAQIEAVRPTAAAAAR
jgi:ferredoxin